MNTDDKYQHAQALLTSKNTGFRSSPALMHPAQRAALQRATDHTTPNYNPTWEFTWISDG
ncbi:hypothetical protein E2C01_085964 [Portunus trituberculatus]|uniref:Uncharacterized protein n=1 Tax=Portunus trituberculatus TaxID=210409 RepID=A0A5B7JAA7_PORTR|nr:hypothetical protein [Portunus trituberculatus]